MTDRDDKTRDERLPDEDKVSRAYDVLRGDGPPASVDASILAAAHAAVGAKTGSGNNVVRLQRWRKWTVPAALAASVVLAVPLVVRVFDAPQAPEYATDAVRDPANRQFRIALPDQDRSFADREESGAAGRRSGDEQDAIVAAQRADAARPAPAPASPTEFSSSPVHDEADMMSAREQVPPAARVARKSEAETRESASPGNEAPAAVASESVAGRATADGTDARTDFGRARRARLDAARPAQQQDALQRMHFEAKDPGVWLDQIAELYNDGASWAARRALGDYLDAYPAQPPPEGYPLAVTDAIYDEKAIVEPVDSWLARIDAMARVGRIDAAREELRMFFERHPDYVLPDGFPLARADAARIER